MDVSMNEWIDTSIEEYIGGWEMIYKEHKNGKQPFLIQSLCLACFLQITDSASHFYPPVSHL